MSLSDLKCYMIVVNGNAASEYYADYCTPTWEAAGIKVERFRAFTPDDLPKLHELRFTEYRTDGKYLKLGLKADITPTERACWYSHFALWQEACYLREPILILEHDTYLEHPEKLWYDPSYGMIFYDKAAMGSYVIQPDFAKELVTRCIDSIIGCGPYGHIASYRDWKNNVVNERHKKYIACSNQVMNDDLGNTIDHFCNRYPEHWPPEKFHEFKKI